MKKYDLLVIGSGPGGYIAAIRAAQLGKTVAIIEKDKLGGVCLNRGCIPTKALIKSAHAAHELHEFKALGINIEGFTLDGSVAVQRSGGISDRISKGVGMLMKKNMIDVIEGHAVLKTKTVVDVTSANGTLEQFEATNIIIATGAHYKSFPGLKHDGDRLIGAYEALKMETLPKSIAIIGAGAIGVEFAYFWNAFGVAVHIFELMDHLLPLEDEDSSKEVERAYRKYGIKTSLGLTKVSVENSGEAAVICSIDKSGKEQKLSFEKCLIAVGMTGNIEGIGLESLGIATERGFIKTNDGCQTNVTNIYAIGDVSGPPLLAHVASHQGLNAVAHICGMDYHPIDLDKIPGCTYCYPQVASIGKTEQELQQQNIKYQVGKLPFIGNGKAIASNEKSGFIKVLLNQQDKLLGAHIVGDVATELLHEYSLMISNDMSAAQIINTIHPHPTLGEWLQEAVLLAKQQALNF